MELDIKVIAPYPLKNVSVRVQHYISTFSPGFFGGKNKAKTIDQYLHDNSQDKNKVTDKIKNLMKDQN